MSEKRLSEVMSDATHAVGEAQDALQGAITKAINTHFDAGIQFERERIVELFKPYSYHDEMCYYEGKRICYPEDCSAEMYSSVIQEILKTDNQENLHEL